MSSALVAERNTQATTGRRGGMFRHPVVRGATTTTVTYLVIRLVFYTGPDLGIGNVSTTWSTTLVAAALGAVVTGYFAPATGPRRLLTFGFTAAASGGLVAVSLILLAYLLGSNLFEALLAGDVGAAGWTLLVTAFVWVTLFAIVIAAAIVSTPLAVLVARLDDGLGD